jgi:hypothetical protein
MIIVDWTLIRFTTCHTHFWLVGRLGEERPWEKVLLEKNMDRWKIIESL